jgi:hypothetical protein
MAPPAGRFEQRVPGALQHLALSRQLGGRGIQLALLGGQPRGALCAHSF